MFPVGSIVRAKRGTKRCRATVATVEGVSAVAVAGAGDGDPQSAAAAGSSKGSSSLLSLLCLLWEPYYPVQISERFLITPAKAPPRAEETETETTVGIDSVEALLPFETEIAPHNEKNHITNYNYNQNQNQNQKERRGAGDNNASVTTIALWKDRGDQLLRLGDPSSAASCYEKALFDSSSVSISVGGTVILSVDGFPRIAEVDCVEEDTTTKMIDVTLVHNGDERTVKESSVLLGVLKGSMMPNGVDDGVATTLQERILLNLARCMHQLSDLDTLYRPKYLKSAVLAATLAITISSFRDEEEQKERMIFSTGGGGGGSTTTTTTTTQCCLSKHAQSALILRCKAYMGLSKWSRAAADARKLQSRGGGGGGGSGDSFRDQGRKLLVSIERKKKAQASTDKKLAKDICRLVQFATTTTTTTSPPNNSNASESDGGASRRESPVSTSTSSLGRRSSEGEFATKGSFTMRQSEADNDPGDVTTQNTNVKARTGTDSPFFSFGFPSIYHIAAALSVVLISFWMADGH